MNKDGGKMTGKFLGGEELCVHGVGHGGIHGCDGCCNPDPLEANKELNKRIEHLLIKQFRATMASKDFRSANKYEIREELLELIAQEVNKAVVEELESWLGISNEIPEREIRHRINQLKAIMEIKE